MAFSETPSLHTAAHEAAHLVQQEAGVELDGAMGSAGDVYERHADRVADAVVRGGDAQRILDEFAGATPRPGVGGVIQRIEDAQPADRTTETRYVIRRGDTLSKLSKRFLGDARRWREIKARNPAEVHGTDMIIVGKLLIIPAATEAPGGVCEEGGESPAVEPIDMLRTSVAASDGISALQTYRTLTDEERTTVRGDSDLFGSLMGVVSRVEALALVAETEPEPALQLELATLRTPVESLFLTAALAQAGIDSPAALIANATTLQAMDAYVTIAVLDPIVNGAGITAEQQIAMLADATTATLLDTAWGQSPLLYMAGLIAEPAFTREGMISFPTVRAAFVSDPVALQTYIAIDSDPYAWFEALAIVGETAVAATLVAGDETFWGQPLLDNLATMAVTVEVNGDEALQTAVVSACILVGGDLVSLEIMQGLKLTLPEAVGVFDRVGVLTAEMLTSLVIVADDPEQYELASDEPAMIVLAALLATADPLVIFANLVTAPITFTQATIESATFAAWIARDEATLIAVVTAVADDMGWATSFEHYDNWRLFLTVAGDATLQPRMRDGLVASNGYGWLVGAADKPLSADADATTLLALYGDGAHVTTADKYKTWGCLYTCKLAQPGDDMVFSWGTFTTHSKRYVAEAPNDLSMNLIFAQVGQMPRNHVNTAKTLMMCHHFTHWVNPFIGANHWVDADEKKMAAPGHNVLGTSYYFGGRNTIVMRSTAAGAGSPDTGLVGNQYGSPGAVNTPSTGPLSPTAPQALSYFENHLTHEFGHAVGNRTVSTLGKTPDEWTKTYGAWTTAGNAAGYARLLGFTPAMDGTAYTLAHGTKSVSVDGDDLREFLTDIAEGKSVAKDDPADELGSINNAFTALAAHPVLSANLLVRTVDEKRGSMPDGGYYFPYGLTPGVARVVFYSTRWGNDWVSYDRAAWDNKVSHYSVASYKEMFAEMYTAKYNGGALPPAIGANDPAAMFTTLESASLEELGGPATSGGAAEGATEAAPADTSVDPSLAEMRPWP